MDCAETLEEVTMETIILMFIAGMGLGAFNDAVGDHQEPVNTTEYVAVYGENGETLYLNKK